MTPSRFDLRDPSTRLRMVAYALLLASGAAGLSACSMASSSHLINSDLASDRCSSDVGGYYLSKSYLTVNVVSDKGTPKLDSIIVTPKADRDHGYCLDFLASPTSHDTFVVAKTDDFLLQKITSKADDQSTQIVKNISQAVFVALSGLPQDPRAGDWAETVSLFKGQYDPFDSAQAAIVNDGLKDTGFCLVLEDPERGVPVGAGRFCDNPFIQTRREAALAASSQPVAHKHRFTSYTRGVLYRPRLAYTLYLFKNQRSGRRLPGHWQLWQSATVYLENQAPILSVGVDRTYFAQRETTLLFQDGMLQDINIDKGSELANFSEIPLEIAGSLSKLPSNIVQAKINVTNKRENLIKAQDALLQQQRLLAKDRGELRTAVDAANAAGASVGNPGGAVAPPQEKAQAQPEAPTANADASCESKVQACVATGTTVEACRAALCGQ